MANLYTKQADSVSYDNLFSGETADVNFKGITIASGQGVLKRGTVIGIITASGKGVIADSSKADGSQIADCILTDDVDATSADVVAIAYISGLFNRRALIFGGTDDTADHEATLRTKGIFLKDNIAY